MKNQKSKIKNQKYISGVTMIELLVVLAVLTLILGVTSTIFISIVQRQKLILEEQELLNRVSYVTEYMARSLRDALKDTNGSCSGTGYDYLLTHFDSAAGFYQGVKFITKDNICQEFFLDTDNLLKEIKNGQSAQGFLSYKFKYVRFIINGDKNISGASQQNTVQPRMTIVLDIQFTVNGQQQEKIIQTTVSQSSLNVPSL